MNQTEEQIVSAEPIQDILRKVSFKKAKELDELFEEVQPMVALDYNSDQNVFQAVHGNPNLIRIGIQCSKRLEAHAHATAVIMSAFSVPEFASLSTDEKNYICEPANRLLTWAVGSDVQRWLSSYGVSSINPRDVLSGTDPLPKPPLEGMSDDQKMLGKGIFLWASSFILLHELGHLKLGHRESNWDNEKEADQFAADWLSSAAEESEDPEFAVLACPLGIAIALMWLTIFNVYFGQMGCGTHPEAYDRLFHTLERILVCDDEETSEMVWEVCGSP